ncbi:MAG: ABC transporter permease, partial [Actinobacteria bacterium]
ALMRRVLAIAALNLRELTRDRTEFVSVIVLPLLLTWVFGTAFGSSGVERPLEIPVADKDGSAYSQALVARIADAPAFDVKPMTDAEARALVREGDAPVAVIVPAGFGAALEQSATPSVEVVSDPSSQRAQAALEVVRGAATRTSADVVAARAAARVLYAAPPAFAEGFSAADGIAEPVTVKAVTVRLSGSRASELEAPANTQYSLGFTVFFVFMVALGSAGGVLEERELGTLRRLLAAPARKAEILGGKVTGIAFVAAFEAAMLVGFGALFFGVPWGKDPAAVALLLLALVLAATGLGVMLSALVRTRSQLSAIGPVLSTALAMLGGCYWPIEITS